MLDPFGNVGIVTEPLKTFCKRKIRLNATVISENVSTWTVLDLLQVSLLISKRKSTPPLRDLKQVQDSSDTIDVMS